MLVVILWATWAWYSPDWDSSNTLDGRLGNIGVIGVVAVGYVVGGGFLYANSLRRMFSLGPETSAGSYWKGWFTYFAVSAIAYAVTLISLLSIHPGRPLILRMVDCAPIAN